MLLQVSGEVHVLLRIFRGGRVLRPSATNLRDPPPLRGFLTPSLTRPIRTKCLFLKVKLTGGFSAATRKLLFQNGTTLNSSHQKGGAVLNHTSASSASYKIDLRNKETLFTSMVSPLQTIAASLRFHLGRL